MYINTLEGYFCTAGVKVFVLDLAFRITVQGICIIRTEFFYIKVGRSHADLFIRSKGDTQLAVGQAFFLNGFNSGQNFGNTGLIVGTQQGGTV